MYIERIKYLDRTERRIAAVTPQIRWIHLAQAIQDAYNDFKRDINSKSRQMTLFYHKFRVYDQRTLFILKSKNLGENLDNVVESTQIKKIYVVDSKYKIGG
jgi:hypothetical protein